MSKPHRLRYRFDTPPPVDMKALRDANPDKKIPQLETPQRSAILSVLYFCEKKKIPCSYEELEEVFGFSAGACTRVASSKRPRRLQHSDEVDRRGSNKRSSPPPSPLPSDTPKPKKNPGAHRRKLKPKMPRTQNRDKPGMSPKPRSIGISTRIAPYPPPQASNPYE